MPQMVASLEIRALDLLGEHALDVEYLGVAGLTSPARLEDVMGVVVP
jgi:hypothetical protein